MKILILLFAIISSTNVYSNNNIVEYNYSDFTLWINCSERMATKFEFITKKDLGNYPRLNSFHFDKTVPLVCQQKSIKSYGSLYDRGHLVSSNQTDSTILSEYESFNITNVLPQTKELNRGAWLQTERITECYRDLTELHVYGGVILNKVRAKDLFQKDWGIKTPNYFWKVIIDEPNKRNIAWVFPNSITATAKNIDKFIVSIDIINTKTGEHIKTKNSRTDTIEKTTWLLPNNCKSD